MANAHPPDCPHQKPGISPATAYKNGCRCPEGRKANNHAAIRWRMKSQYTTGTTINPQLTDATPSRRRIQALNAIGYTGKNILEALGKTARGRQGPGMILRPTATKIRIDTAQKIAELYDKLEHTEGPSTLTRQRAKKLGYQPPWAWKNIDDGLLEEVQPTATPAPPRPGSSRSDATNRVRLADYAEARYRGMTHQRALTDAGLTHSYYLMLTARCDVPRWADATKPDPLGGLGGRAPGDNPPRRGCY